MVFGLNVKPAHGYYVEVDVLDGDLNAVEIADQTPDGGLPLNRDYARVSGRAVIPDHMPTRMAWGDAHGHPIPDFDNGHVLNVSDRAKALIESFEPEVHQFLPVDYFDRKGRPLGRRWFLIVCNRLDTVDREHSNMVLRRGMLWVPPRDLDTADLPPGVDPTVPARMVFNRAQTRGAHLWQDKHIRHGPYLSDELAAALQAGEFTGLRLHEAETV